MTPNNQKQLITLRFKEAADIYLAMSHDTALVENIQKASQLCIEAIHRGNKILIAGNGGSAADAQHMAAELVGRYMKNRAALSAIALTTDASILTAVGNDFGFEEIFARQVEALGNEDDVFIGISTSGKSPNILKAMGVAKTKGLKIVGLTGNRPETMEHLSDLLLRTPTEQTPRIQECHTIIEHLICELIDT